MNNANTHSSLRSFAKPVDTLRMTVESRGLCTVFVEGPRDVLLLQAISGAVFLHPLNSRPKVLSECEGLARSGVTRFLAVVDRDFDEADCHANSSWCFPYPEIDAEAFLVSLGALDVAIESAASIEKLNTFGGTAAARDHIVNVARKIGILRALNTSHALGWNFRALDWTDVISKESWDLDVTELARRLDTTRRSKGLPAAYPSREEVMTLVKDAASGDAFSGKDASRVLAGGLRKRLGDYRSQDLVALCTSMLQGIGRAHVAQSDWLRQLRAAAAAVA